MVLLAMLALRAQEPPSAQHNLNKPPPSASPPPPLSDVVKLQIQNAALTVEVWQTKLQLAQSELPKAQAAFNKLITDHTPPGYQLDQSLSLVPVKP